MRIDPADSAFSKWIRNRDKVCQRCHKPSESLQCSHFYGRTMESVRFEPDNCDALCYGCHRYWEKEDREAYRAFKLKQLGQARFDSLILQAHTYHKKDRAFELIRWKLALQKQDEV